MAKTAILAKKKPLHKGDREGRPYNRAVAYQ
jgi:hypothetical protein